MSISADMHTILARAAERARELLAPQDGSPPSAEVHAAFWLYVRSGGACETSSLYPVVTGEPLELDPSRLVDPSYLSLQGFRLRSGLLALGETNTAEMRAALARVARRKPRTEELSGPADDPLCLLGLLLLTAQVNPQLIAHFGSWVDASGLSPVLRVAFILAGVEGVADELRLDPSSLPSLAAFLLIAAADSRLRARLYPAVNPAEVARLLAIPDPEAHLSRGAFDSLAVLVALELLLQRGAPSSPNEIPLTSVGAAWSRDPTSTLVPGGIMTLDQAESQGLVRELARTIANAEQATGLLREIGFPVERIPPFANFTTPIDFWRRVCTELGHGVVADGLARLFAAVARMFPGNPVFNPGPVASSPAPVVDAPVQRAPATRNPAGAHGSISVVLVCANPRGTDPLRLGAEERALREAIRLATHRERFSITVLHAATIDDLRRALLRDTYDIVQFSGHGTESGLMFEDAVGKVMRPDSAALAELLQRRGARTVVLNACDSLGVGMAGTSRLEHIIAMDGPIGDTSAIEFSRGFYDALGEGLDVPEAFEEGVSCCKLKCLPVNAVLLRKGESAAP